MAVITKRRARRRAQRDEMLRRLVVNARNPLKGRGNRPFPPDELEGGAGVREPRRPSPTMPAGALELDLPTVEYLSLTR